ncbi:hypothetical protein [Streptomyces sp. NPDC048392]|uniref:hypothetical protein n=1 Tax=Streptomyces sp. NPDC048392 TaxID=3365543 RepID=UPI003712FC6A
MSVRARILGLLTDLRVRRPGRVMADVPALGEGRAAAGHGPARARGRAAESVSHRPLARARGTRLADQTAGAGYVGYSTPERA